MSTAADKVRFRYVLLVLAVVIISISFITGELLVGLPNNWFVRWMAGIFTRMDEVGFFNVWSGQTQGTHYLYFLLWKPAQVIAEGKAYFTLVFSLLWYFVTISSLFLGCYLFYKIVEHFWGRQKALILSMAYILLSLTFQWYTVIDSLAIAALLGTIYCSCSGRGILGGVLLGISVAIKPIGVVILPVLIKSEFLTRKARITMVVTSLTVLAALLLPFVFGNFQIFMSALHWQSGRPPWGTLYAFALWLLKKPYPDNPFFQDYSGITPRDLGWTGITPVHSIMTTPVPSYDPWYNILFITLLACTLVVFLLAKRVRTEVDLLWGCLFTLAVYFILFYGWSGQFFFWLAPFLLASFPLLLAVCMRLVGLLEYPVFYGLYLARVAPDLVTAAPGLSVSLTSVLAFVGVPGYWSLIILRTMLILAFSVIAWRKLVTQVWRKVWRFPEAAIP